MQWDSAAYLRFKAERTQPSIDLVKRIDLEQPRKLLDVGCGPGNSTQVLADAFPNALRISRHRQFTGDDRSHGEGRSPGHGVPGCCDAPEFALAWGGRVRCGVFQRLHPVGPRPSPAHPRTLLALLRTRATLAVQVPAGGLSGAHPPDQSGNLPPRTSGAPNSPPRRGSSIRFAQEAYFDILAAEAGQFQMWQTASSPAVRRRHEAMPWIRVEARGCAPA